MIDKDKAVEAQRRVHIKNGYNVDGELLTADQLRELFKERDEYESNVLYWQDQHEQEEKRRKEVEAECDRYKSGIMAVKKLIEQSYGVNGLHLDGDVASWETIRTGGHFEEWLKPFDEAIDTQRGVK